MLKCDYCGRENPDQTPACSGCGTPFVDGSQAAAGVPEPDRPISFAGLLECALGLFGLIAGHTSGIVHLVKGMAHLDTAVNVDSPAMHLERAARLESVSLRAALALYEEIVQQYPGTGAAIEASRAVQTIRTAYPELARED
jgi:hypothetical protein